MGVEGDGRAVAEPVTDDQIGNRFHACRMDGILRHRVRLDLEAEIFQQSPGKCGVCGAIARRIVGRRLNQFGEEGDLAILLGIEEGGNNVIHDLFS